MKIDAVVPICLLLILFPVESATVVPATDPGIGYVGRFDRTTPSAPRMSWPGSRITATFEGTRCDVILDDSRDSGNCFNVFIDGQARPMLVTFAVKDTYTVATGLSDGAHNLILYKRTESESTSVTFRGLVLEDGKALRPAQPGSPRRIEYIGDSHTSGLVIEAPNWNSVNVTRHNAYRSYAAVAGRYFGAETHLIAVSGKGLVHNHSDLVEQSAFTMRGYYRRTLTGSDNPAWNFSSWRPQVVVMNIGTNDFAECFQVAQGETWRKPARASLFIDAYKGLLDSVRALYPGVKIVCMGPYDDCGCKDSTARVVRGIVTQQRSAGKTDLAFCGYPAFRSGDYVCCHPGPAFAQKMADSLVKVVSSLTGWGDSTTITGINRRRTFPRPGKGPEIRVSTRPGRITVSSANGSALKHMTVYGTDGRTWSSSALDRKGQLVFDSPDAPAGAYVVRIAGDFGSTDVKICRWE